MIKAIQTVLVMASVLSLWPAQCAAQPLRPRLGEEKAAAVEAMLDFVFPGTTPVWGVDLYAAAADGSRKRISLTSIAAVSNGSTDEFVAGLSDFDVAGQVLTKLKRGDSGSVEPLPQTLVAVVKNSSGYFQPVASLLLDSNHMFTAVSSLGSDPENASHIFVAYDTVDVVQDQVVEMIWYAVLDANMKVLQKWPGGIELQGTGRNHGALLRSLVISRTSTGVIISDPVAQKATQLACPAICEPTLEQLLASN